MRATLLPLLLVLTGCGAPAGRPPPAAQPLPAAASRGGAPDAIAQALKRGYRPVLRGDTVTYCIDEAPTGSRLRRTVCRSAEELEAAAREAERAAHSPSIACGRASACAGGVR